MTEAKKKIMVPLAEEDHAIFQQAIAVLCYQNGGTLKLGPVPDELRDRPFRVVTRFKDDGVEFTVEHDDVQ